MHARKIAFRFLSVYFGLFCLATQIVSSLVPLPNVDLPDPSALWAVRQMVFWTAAHVFGAKLPLVYTGSGSGDKTFDWVLCFCLLVLSALATVIWSVLDRRRTNYAKLYSWFRVFIRFALASQMIVYGMSKVVPLQMPFAYLSKLIEPTGNQSPMGVLWFSIGASPSYEIFAGSAELLGGILLVFPRATTFGALVCLADMIQVFALNMTYDVPVKLFSFHLILMSLLLLAPSFSRLADFFFLRREVKPFTEPELFHTRRGRRLALAAQLVLGVWLVGMNAYGSRTAWYTYGGGRPKPPLYGIWNVEEMLVDGQLRAPLLSDRDRWRRVVFDFPGRVTLQRMDDSFAGFGAAVNSGTYTMVLSKSDDAKFKGNLAFALTGKDRLNLAGEMGGHKVEMKLQLVDREKFLIVSRGFHWIQEYPFNR
jgi:uncharacterized membrane protein YphA (DoxX/SURF4 family)